MITQENMGNGKKIENSRPVLTAKAITQITDLCISTLSLLFV